jgi:TatD DNase family protein
MSAFHVGDAHCHLGDLRNPEEALDEARAAGVGPVVAVSMGPHDARRVLELRLSHPNMVRAGVGLHPSRVPALSDEELRGELSLAAERAPAADLIGEIGLDYKDATDPSQQRRQREVLQAMLDLAARCGRPVNLHTRRADRDLMEAAVSFTRRTGLPALLHWFTHSAKMARACGEAGLFISAGPSILTDARQAEVARAIHRDFLLVETDAPVVYAGGEASPAWAARVMSRLAEARGEDPAALAEQVAANLGRYLMS